MAVNKERANAVAFLVVGIFIGLGVMSVMRPAKKPNPDPVCPVDHDGAVVLQPKKGTHIVAILDDSAPSIPMTLSLDDPVTRAYRSTEQFTIYYLRADKDIIEKNNYDKLITAVGGAPAMLIFNKNADKDNLVAKGRWPTDIKARNDIFNKAMGNLPPPKAISLVPAPINSGTDAVCQTDDRGREFIEFKGKKRFMAYRPDADKLGAYTRYGEANPVFPVKEWFELNRRDVFDEEWIFDQANHNSCVGNGGVGSMELVMWFQGMSRVKLSPACAYSKINGGQDAGACIPDLIPCLTNQGTCLFKTWGQDPVFLNALPPSKRTQVLAEAKNFRLDKEGSYRCTNWESTVSALLSGYSVTFGIQVTKNFMKFDDDGVCGHDIGPGNHCVRADGLHYIASKKKWVLDMVNSWGEWGPWNNGRAYLDKDHLFGNGNRADVIAFRSMQRATNEQGAPPAYLARDAEYQLSP